MSIKKFNYIYKTTCDVTGKFYIGMHSTDNLEDGYLGSGKILGMSRSKYGDEHHTKEILHHCDSRESLKDLERTIVNEVLLVNEKCMNLKIGGEGGWEYINKTGRNIRNDFVRDAEYREKISKSKKGIKPKLTDEAREKLSSENVMKNPDVAKKVSIALTGKEKSIEHKEKIAARITEWHRERKQRVHGV